MVRCDEQKVAMRASRQHYSKGNIIISSDQNNHNNGTSFITRRDYHSMMEKRDEEDNNNNNMFESLHNTNGSNHKKQQRTMRTTKSLSSSFHHSNTKKASSTSLMVIRTVFVLAVLALSRTIWNSLSITTTPLQRHPPDVVMDALFAPPQHRNNKAKSSSRHLSNNQARARRPPPISNKEKGVIPPLPQYLTSHKHVMKNLPSASNKRTLSQDYCGYNHPHPIFPNSTVLVSGALSHELGLELLLGLAEHCGVSSLVAIDYDALDTESSQQLAFLIRRLPGFSFHWMDPVLSEHQVTDILMKRNPTHIIHLESTTFLTHNKLSSETTTIIMHPSYAIRKSMRELESLCKAIVKYQLKRKTKQQKRPEFLVLLASGGMDHPYVSMAAESMFPSLIQTYRSRYHVKAKILLLPKLFGNFQEGAYWVGDVLAKKSKPDIKKECIHLDYAIPTVLTGMTTDTPSSIGSKPSAWVLPSTITTTLDEISTDLWTIHRNDTKKLKSVILQNMLSWYHKQKYPYETSKMHGEALEGVVRKALEFTRGRLRSNQTTGISPINRRQHGLFPCVSECAAHVHCQEQSAFSSLIPLVKNTTDECKFIVYIADFSTKLSELPTFLVTPKGQEGLMWPRQSFCLVAFVSRKSELMQSILQNNNHNDNTYHQPVGSMPYPMTTSNTTMDSISFNDTLHWKLYWVEQDDTEMSEADFTMPKMVPGNFFSSNTTKAMYWEPQYHVAFPPLCVLWFFMAKNMDLNGRPATLKNVKRSGTSVTKEELLPAEPARHKLFLTLSYNEDLSFWKDQTAQSMTKLLMEQRDLTVIEWPRQQLEYYNHMLATTTTTSDNNNIGFRLTDSSFLIHNFHSQSRGRFLRCSWYEEHLFWDSPRGMEDLSLSFWMDRMRRNHRLIQSSEDTDDDEFKAWGEQLVPDGYSSSSSTTTTTITPILDNTTLPEKRYFVMLNKQMSTRRQYD